MPPAGVAALLLAAGASRRLGTPKQLLRTTDGDTLLGRAVRAALAADCHPVVVVVGAHAELVKPELDRVLASLGGVASDATTSTDRPMPSITVVDNGHWSSGMASSLVAGLEPVDHTSCSGVLLLACDQPSVTPGHLRALIRLHERNGGRAVSSYAGVSGIPAIWPRTDWPALRALSGDRGARALLRGDEPHVPLPGGALDLDTPADVEQWRAGG